MDWTLDLDQDLDLDTGLDLELDNISKFFEKVCFLTSVRMLLLTSII